MMTRAGNVSLWVEREGRGEPLLLITGLGYASWCWLELRAALRQGFDLVAFDNRGTGRSGKPEGPYSIPMMADDAAALLESLGLASAHVLGHSMGGYIALTLALRHPAKVRSLVLVGTGPGGPDAQPIPEETQKAWDAARGKPAVEYARTTMPRSFAPGWTDAHPAEFDRILARRLEFPTPPPQWLAQYNACVDYYTTGIDVSRIGCPTLVIHGQQDRVVPHHNGVLLAQRMPRATLVSLPQGGHLPMLEDPPGFAARVRQHLEAQKDPKDPKDPKKP
jgi:3-oxoadipate enol-lactonase